MTVEFFLVGQNNGPMEVATLKVRFWGFSVTFSFSLLRVQTRVSQAASGIGVVQLS